jgi:hypothetical protein
MRNMQRFEFSPSSPDSGSASLLPFLPVRLDFSGSAVGWAEVRSPTNGLEHFATFYEEAEQARRKIKKAENP